MFVCLVLMHLHASSAIGSIFSFPSTHMDNYTQANPSLCSLSQEQTCSPTAQRSAKPSATQIAAGCQVSCPPRRDRVPITAATCTCRAWTLCPTLRYLRARHWQAISHSQPLAKRRHTTPTRCTNINTINTTSMLPR